MKVTLYPAPAKCYQFCQKILKLLLVQKFAAQVYMRKFDFAYLKTKV